MGDRIGIVFNTAKGTSDLYAQSHWGGRDLLVAAQTFIREVRTPDPGDDPDALVREFVAWCTSTTWDPESVEVRSYSEDGDYEDCEDEGVFTVGHDGFVW